MADDKNFKELIAEQKKFTEEQKINFLKKRTKNSFGWVFSKKKAFIYRRHSNGYPRGA